MYACVLACYWILWHGMTVQGKFYKNKKYKERKRKLSRARAVVLPIDAVG